MSIYETYISYAILLVITLLSLLLINTIKKGFSLSQFIIERKYIIYLYNDLLATYTFASTEDLIEFTKKTGVKDIQYIDRMFTINYENYKINISKKFDSLRIVISDDYDYRDYTFNPYLAREYIIKDEYGRNLKNVLQSVYRYFL